MGMEVVEEVDVEVEVRRKLVPSRGLTGMEMGVNTSRAHDYRDSTSPGPLKST